MAFERIKKFFAKANEEPTGTRITKRDFLDNPIEGVDAVAVQDYLKTLAFVSIVRKIGSAVAAVEWETYRNHKKVNSKESWAWNYDPNPNQTKVQFFQKLVHQLYANGEALVVEWGNGYRYIADSFATTQKLGGDEYESVVIHGQQTTKTYQAKDVLHVTLEGDAVNLVLAGILGAEGALIKSASSAYIRNQGMHGILHIDDLAEADADFEETYEELVNVKMQKYFKSENAVLPLFKGYEFREQESTGGSTKSSLAGTRDIRSLYDDIKEDVAQAMGVPVSIATGKQLTKEDFDQFITLVVKPIVEMFKEELNRKLYGMSRVQNGAYIAPDYGHIKHTDLFDIADPIDKLIGSGAFSVNDIRKRLGLEPIEKDWANEHWMTKNYAPADEMLSGLDVESSGKEEGTDAE